MKSIALIRSANAISDSVFFRRFDPTKSIPKSPNPLSCIQTA
jgi:hypothetical protein